MSAAIPAGLSDVLARPMDGVARVVITHEVHREFRWLVVIEITLAVIGCLILLPCFAIAAFSGSSLDNIDLPEFRGRTHNWWQELVVRVLDPHGRVLAEVRSRPDDAEASQGIVAAVLGAAQRQGVVVVETLLPFGTSAAETRHVWYGGRPLLTSPEMRSEEAATQVLLQSGWQVERGPDSVLVSYPVPRTGRIIAWLILIFLVCPLVPFLFLFASGRRMLGDLWADANGAPPPRAYYEIRAGSIEARTVRGDEVRDRNVIDGADLLGIVYGPSLTWSKHEMRRVDPSLSLVSTARQITLGVPPQLGPALRDLITAATVRLRTERPELGLLAGPSPTRCPWCSQLYVLEPGARCPGCGAPGLLQ